MRIGIDVRLWNETGVGRYIRNLVTELAQTDVRNEYFLFALNKDIPEIEKMTVSRKHRWRIIPVKSRWHSLSEQTDFVRTLYKYPLDLMHFPYFSLPVLYRRPFVVTIHDLIIHHFSTGRASTLSLPLYQTKRFFFNRVLGYGLTHSQKIIAPLDCVKDDIVNTFHIAKEKIVVTKEGYDQQISVSSSPVSNKKDNKVKSENWKMENENYFLYVGNAYPHKNVEKLIEGFLLFKNGRDPSASLHFAQDDIKLYLVGKKDYFYEQLQQEQRNNTDIVFKHDVTDQELASLYANATAFVSASVMEGFGLPPLEAMANGCVPLVSDIPSFHEVCEDAGVYFDQNDHEKIAEAMLEWMKVSEKEKKHLMEQGKKRVAQFSWKRMAQETIAIYEGSNRLRSSQ